MTFTPLSAAVVAVIATVVVGLILLNLKGNEKQVARKVKRLYDTHDPQFIRAMGNLLGPPIIAGNRFDTLLNGDQIFPAMLGAIRAAQRTISFESYIYWSGDVGKEFADALADRARAGVRVHLLLDWLGSGKLDKQQLALMEDAGVEVQRFHAPAFYKLTRFNNRTHRKVLVVDGIVGFTGGVGIADEWQGHAQDEKHWRDSHFRARGPVVAQMQAVFMDNWMTVSGDVLHGPDYFPPLDPAGEQSAQMFSSSPEGGSESMHVMYLLAITAAAKSITLSSAYFVPDALALDALVAAAQRGVSVRIITPGKHMDAQLVRRASRACFGRLLEAGVQIHEYQPTMFHCKVMVVDDVWVSVGSTNFDSRSFGLNDEANLNVLDASFAAQQMAVFEDDLKHSRAITLDEWKHRPLHEKALERAASLLRLQL